MEANWKLENGIICEFRDDEWVQLNAEDIYSIVFSPDDSDVEKTSFKTVFSDIRFSKFSVEPQMRIELQGEKIILTTFFCKAGHTYPIDLPKVGGADYAFANNKWFYYSGEYYQIAEILARANVASSEITFKQYIDIIQSSQQYPGLQITDTVNEGLKNLNNTDAYYQPNNLKATLYPYQRIGFKWLQLITDNDCGCILGDDMGLGKTIQVISLLLERKDSKKAPSLVVAPLSLLENWKREINKFAPDLSVQIHHGPKRTGRYKDLLPYDVIVTSYGAAVSDLSLFTMINWDLLVLDEAQNIKTPDTTRTKTIKLIPHRSSIAVTGTPFENHMTDLWSLIDFTIPGCLGTLQQFMSEYPDDIYGAEKIEPLLTAVMLRRKVADVAQDLPEKVVIPQALVMESDEAIRYEDVRLELSKSVAGGGISLASLTKLRMFCAHPFLVSDSSFMSSGDPAKHSAKYRRFCEIVEEIIEQNEKVIVFTSYIKMMELIKEDISYRFGIPVDCINGKTPSQHRQGIVDAFYKRPNSAMLVLNPRAAGVGLNITAANHVIHYNLEWNPAIEDQATARSFRRGQDKTVFVHRLFYAKTVEELVNDKIYNKRIMSDAAVIGSSGTEDTRSLLINALGISPLSEG